jgi:hypothetical protein
MPDRIWNGTVVRERFGDKPAKGVVISQTSDPNRVIVRYEGGNLGEWEEPIYSLEVLDESPLVDGTRAYSN